MTERGGDAEAFDTGAEAWREWQEEPWGRLRYAVAEANLLRHLPPADETTAETTAETVANTAAETTAEAAANSRALRVLDLGGGDGGDALRLAAHGHHVTVVDYAPAMLATAARRAVRAGLGDRIACVTADVTALPSALADGGFDLVLLHGVLPYARDTTGTLGAALGAAREGGLVSVIAMNRHSEPLRAAVRTMDPDGVLAALDAPTVHTDLFDAELRLHTEQELAGALRELGCDEVHPYGIRVFCDYIPDDAVKFDPAYYARLERLDIATAGRAPYRHTARLLHLLAVKGRGPGRGRG
ncbi:class I SAM-dependent methyltransferase [Streptomyces sp. NPDC014779]|uniref:class I SAM-dependent methyltransferase n=1 Tax=Streptomyces sp. NPDC014779 TaxID=3364911 RepID=UPI0036F6C7EB